MDEQTAVMAARLELRFDQNVIDFATRQIANGANLDDRGDHRIRLTEELRIILQDVVLQIDDKKSLVDLIYKFGNDLYDIGELDLSRQCMEVALRQVDNITPEICSIEMRITIVLFLALCSKREVLANSSVHISPMMLSRLLSTIEQIREALDSIFARGIKEQEGFSHLILNCAKLIYDIGQPMIWWNCGKYVMESLMLAAICMDAVINLCTMRHMSLRMKLYSSAFYAALSQGTSDEAQAILRHAERQMNELKEREELNIPLPANKVAALAEFSRDIAVMTEVLKFWKDPDTLNISAPNDVGQKSLLECCKVQQLTSSNVNETWKRRSNGLVKAVSNYLSQSTDHKLSLQGYLDVLVVSIFDGTVEGINIPESFFNKIFLGLDNLIATSDNSADICLPHILVELKILRSLAELKGLIGSDPSEAESVSAKRSSLNISLELLSHSESLMHSDMATKRKSVLRRVALYIWSAFIYPELQMTMSKGSFDAKGELSDLIPGLLVALRGLLAGCIEDPVLLASLGVVCVQVLLETSKLREAASIAKRVVDSIDDHRALRVDVSSHIPEDHRDLMAVQRASITSSREAIDWFHSEKRLGAHAFAGFGIFGSSSSADFIDLALAELHTDLLSLYFRIEIAYAIEQKLLKISVKSSLTETDAKLKRIGTSTTAGPLTAKPVTRETAAQLIAESSSIRMDQLRCIPTLKSFCCKNNYAKCLLYLEMARAENDSNMKIEYLKAAFDCIEEAEAREDRLKSAFTDFQVMKQTSYPYPIVLARTHKFMVVAPVGCKALKKVNYYQVLARDEGSGTDVYITNNVLGGCEVKVYSDRLSNPGSSSVKISALQSGERYVFASAGFTSSGKLVGDVSATSPSVDAVNPLPTVLLWHCLSEMAFRCKIDGLGRMAAQRVVQRYFVTPPRGDLRCVGNGINLFFDDQPILCQLAIKQSTNLLLYCFVRSFLRTDTRQDLAASFSEDFHWELKKAFQIELLSSLRKIAMVALLAAQIPSHELVLRVVSLGYDTLCGLLDNDERELAIYLQKSILMLATALQSVHKRHWKQTEHMLYCRLIFYSTRCALICASSSSQSKLLTDFFTYPVESISSEDLLFEYLVATSTFYSHKTLFAAEDIKKQVMNIFGSSEIPLAEFWTQSQTKRMSLYRGTSLSLVDASSISPRSSQLKAPLKEFPQTLSDFLAIVISLCKELLESGAKDKVVALLQQYPVYAELLSAPVRTAHAEWKFAFVSPIAERAVASAVAATAAPTKGKVPAVAASVPTETTSENEIPERFSEFSPVESNKQFSSIATMCCIYAEVSFPQAKESVLFPISEFGPNDLIDPEKMSIVLDAQKCSPTELSVEESSGRAGTSAVTSFTESDYIRYSLASIVLYFNGSFSVSSIDKAIDFWNFVVRKWISPYDFAYKFGVLRERIVQTLSSLILNFEKLCRVQDEGDYFDSEMNISSVIESSLSPDIPARTMKQYLYVAKDILVYLLKVLWVLGEHREVVSLGLRLVSVYLTRSSDVVKYVGSHCIPLMIFSQRKLLDDANEARSARESDLNNFVQAWKDEQARKNKKKLRIARLEKSDEELAFDAERSVFEDHLTAAVNLVQENEKLFDSTLAQQKRVDSMFSTGLQLLDKVRINAMTFIDKCKNTIKEREYGDFSELLDDPEFSYELDSIADQYQQVASVLREKKDRLGVIEALKAQGELVLLFGNIKRTQAIWIDTVDGLFNTLDTCKKWEEVVGEAVRRLEYFTIYGALPIIAVLGNLSKYCANNDWDTKTCYSRMAAALSKVPFSGTLGAPLLPHGFAAYVCRELGGTAPLSYSKDRLSLTELCNSIEEILKVLEYQGLILEALPLVVLLEHIYACYMRKANSWLKARLCRIRLLVQGHFFAEAVAMMVDIKISITAIDTGVYDNVLAQLRLYDRGETGVSFDLKENALNSYNSVSFFNNESPDSPRNKAAIEFIVSFPTQLSSFLSQYTVDLPKEAIDPLTEEEKRAEEEAAASAAAAAEAEAIAKNKGKAPPKGKVESPRADPSAAASVVVLKVQMFPLQLVAEVFQVCALFLTEISSLNTRSTSADYSFYLGLNGKAESLLVEVANAAEKVFLDKPKVKSSELCSTSEAEWIALYSRSCLCRAQLHVHKRAYKEARAFTTLVLRRLYGETVHPKLRTEYTDLWFICRFMLCEICHRQGRFEDALSLATSGSQDCAAAYHGYYLRKYLLLRATVNFKLGCFAASEMDVESCLDNYKETNLFDLDLIACRILKVAIIKTKVSCKTRKIGMKTLKFCVELGRESLTFCRDIANSYGFMGPDTNISRGEFSQTVLKNNEITPFEFGFTDLQENYATLTVSPPINPKKAAEASGPRSPLKKKTENREVVEEVHRVVRSGPIDNDGVLVKSEHANIYLKACRSLASCYASLCGLLYEVRNIEESDDLLREQIVLGEDGLKILRYAFKVNATIRCSLLLSVGRTRRASCLNNLNAQERDETPPTVLIDGIPVPIYPCDHFEEAFLKAFYVAFHGGHLWDFMRQAGLELVETFASPKLLAGKTNEEKLKAALVFMVAALKLTNQRNTIFFNAVTLSNDKSFSAVALSEALSNIMTASFTSSMTILGSAIVAAPVSVDPKAKGKPAAAAAPGGTPVPTGRDALFLFSSLLREANPILPEGFELDLIADLHTNLKTTFTAYDQQCSLPGPIDNTSPVSVEYNSVSSLLVPCPTSGGEEKSPDMEGSGLLPYVTMYVVLGGEPSKAAAPASSGKGAPTPVAAVPSDPAADPILTKVTITREEALRYEKRFLEARDVLANSIVRKSENIKKDAANHFLATLVDVSEKLCKQPVIPALSVVSAGSEFKISVDGGERVPPFSLSLKEETLLSLSELFSLSKEGASGMIVDAELCMYLKLIFGYL